MSMTPGVKMMNEVGDELNTEPYELDTPMGSVIDIDSINSLFSGDVPDGLEVEFIYKSHIVTLSDGSPLDVEVNKQKVEV